MIVSEQDSHKGRAQCRGQVTTSIGPAARLRPGSFDTV